MTLPLFVEMETLYEIKIPVYFIIPYKMSLFLPFSTQPRHISMFLFEPPATPSPPPHTPYPPAPCAPGFCVHVCVRATARDTGTIQAAQMARSLVSSGAAPPAKDQGQNSGAPARRHSAPQCKITQPPSVSTEKNPIKITCLQLQI